MSVGTTPHLFWYRVDSKICIPKFYLCRTRYRKLIISWMNLEIQDIFIPLTLRVKLQSVLCISTYNLNGYLSVLKPHRHQSLLNQALGRVRGYKVLGIPG